MIIIHFNQDGSFDVQHGERIGRNLIFDEMLATVARETIAPTINRTYLETPDMLLAHAERRFRRRNENVE